MQPFDLNFAALRARYPDLAQRLDACPDAADVRVIKAQDGGIAYGVDKNGTTQPVTDRVSPVARITSELNQCLPQLRDYTRPVLVMGLYPGNELIYAYDLYENEKLPSCPQKIYVCIDSRVCLLGFLKCWDVRRMIESPRVCFFSEDDAPALVEHLITHPDESHIFTLISGAPDAVLNRIMPPFVRLVEARDAERIRLHAENDTYYDAWSDADLANIIAGKAGRKPRLLMPTCAWSTFIQHSARDTCQAFEQMGWETLLLNMNGMITPYYLTWIIHEFKPDMFLFIDHLRSEAEAVYPRNMMWVTWIQDEMDHLYCKEAGAKIAEYAACGKRDLVVGYGEGELVEKYGYPKDRYLSLNVPANPTVFHPITLTSGQRRQYGCELAFMSNVSMPSDEVAETVIAPAVEKWGISRETVARIHDYVWAEYRAGKTFTDRALFLEALKTYPEVAAVLESGEVGAPPSGSSASVSANGGDQSRDACRQNSEFTQPLDSIQNPESKIQNHPDELVRLFYWRLNDTIYRHVVLEWADELGVDLKLFGHGWDRHPRFRKYARPPVPHGAELNAAYQAARLSLHLNITQGMHQRLWEIVSAGARPLLRVQAKRVKFQEPSAELMRMMVRHFFNPLSDQPDGLSAELESVDPGERDVLVNWLFDLAYSMAQSEKDALPDAKALQAFQQRMAQMVEQMVRNRPDWVIPDFKHLVFSDKATLAARVSAWRIR